MLGIFGAARELSPCIVLLDNIDMLLGASAQDTSSSSLQHQKDVGKGRRTGERHRSARTRHHAVDRMLSTLLVEIDGIYTSTSSITAGKPSVLTDKPSVLVVVTTTAMNCLDRYIRLFCALVDKTS